MKMKSIAFGLLAGLVGLGLQMHSVSAATDEQSDFEIQRIPVETQVNNDVNYFDMQIQPGKKQVIMMKVKNYTDHKVKVKSELRNSMTQVGGGVNFISTAKGLDESLKYPLTSIGHVDKKDRVITLNPLETRTVSATIKMPNDGFRGLVYGDWHFLEETTSKSKDSHVSSNYAYSMGIALRGAHYKVYPELKYDSVKPMLFQKHAAMSINLRNTQPMMLQNVQMKAVITKQGVFSQKRIFSVNNSKIAPNSIVTLPVQWQFDELKPGKYKVQVQVKGENDWNKLPMTWKFIKNIKVDKKAADNINDKIMRKPINKWFYISIATGGLMLISLVELLKLLLTGSK